MLALALLAALAYREMRGPDERIPEAAAAQGLRPKLRQVASGPEPSPGAKTQAAANATAAPPRVDVARRRQLVRELVAGDWEPFVRENLPLAQAGDAESQLQIGTAMTLCRNALRDPVPKPAGEAQDTDHAAAAQAFRQRCKALDLLPQDVSAREWFQRSAAQGNGMALLQLANDRDGGEPVDRRVAELHQAIASFDPSVIDLLIFASATGDNSVATFDSSFAEQALTKCAMGYDCSASGPLYEELGCKRRGCLHADGVERYFELSESRQQYADVQAYSQRLAADLRSGGYDWPEAQQLEKQLRDSDAAAAADAPGP